MYETIRRQFKKEGNPPLSAWFTFRGDCNDEHVIMGTFLYDEYLLQSLGAGAVVIDIGAHIGGVTVQLACQGVRVFAYEPIVENFELLSANVVQNGLSNLVTCHCEAVSGTDGDAVIYLGGDGDSWHRFIAGMNKRTPYRRTLPAVRLDTVMAKDKIGHCDVLKLDAEGAEYDILQYASLATLSRIDRIVGEYHGVGRETGEGRGLLLSYTRGLFDDRTPEGCPAGFDFVNRGHG